MKKYLAAAAVAAAVLGVSGAASACPISDWQIKSLGYANPKEPGIWHYDIVCRKPVVAVKKVEPLEVAVFFDTAKASIKPESLEVLKKAAEWLKANPTGTLRIAAHADARGAEAYNLKLSQARGSNVFAYLSFLGADAKRIDLKAFGESAPAVPDARTAADHALNRRVTLSGN